MARWEPLLEEVVRERYPRLVAYALHLVGERAAAEDLVQEALVSTFAGRARFSSAAEAESYVRRSVASRYIDQGRRRTAEGAAWRRVGSEPVRDVEPVVPGLTSEVERALAALSPRVRACVVLRHMDDLSVRETARVLKLSEGAVKRYVSDGVAALNAALGTTSSTEPHVVVETSGRTVRRGA
ncbi:sigma-70 family RNA polymerase sigma factor [Actinotalea sp. K2]|uniref:sigma-70 family RNA polymerase sigma factor n=1 Tax=Actinotalea sp. K2 TaxID=2939438 RepID=UPI002016C2CD|nr:sigma-70 family RNA polymerase sigma factor [Actinotalea sp. K2]MCL3860734.1 sigma-70 family RNA polymerase sigma factor [Actinotalea sp. K2]